MPALRIEGARPCIGVINDGPPIGALGHMFHHEGARRQQACGPPGRGNRIEVFPAIGLGQKDQMVIGHPGQVRATRHVGIGAIQGFG